MIVSHIVVTGITVLSQISFQIRSLEIYDPGGSEFVDSIEGSSFSFQNLSGFILIIYYSFNLRDTIVTATGSGWGKEPEELCFSLGQNSSGCLSIILSSHHRRVIYG
jgi:hypothetical protein